MIDLTINCEGATPEDLLVAAREAIRRIEAGSYTGCDRAADGTSLLFAVTVGGSHVWS